MVSLEQIHQELLKSKPELQLRSKSRTKIVDRVMYSRIATKIGYSTEEIAEYLKKTKQAIFVYLTDFPLYASELSMCTRVYNNLMADDPETKELDYE